MAVGSLIEAWLGKRGWQLADLARRSSVDLKTLAALRRRDSKRSEFVPQIAAAFGLTVDAFLAGPASLTPGGAAPMRLTPLEEQLVALYRDLSHDRQEDLISLAQRWHNHEHPHRSPANPFAKPKKTA